jgi:predicted nucleic acid-binding protein
VNVAAPFGGDVLIADTSCWRWADRFPPALRAEWDQAIANQQIATLHVVLFELLYRSRNHAGYFQRWLTAFQALYRVLVPDRGAWNFALEAYVELQQASQLEGKSLVDILIAATAARTNLPVLHYDRDYPALATLQSLDFNHRPIAASGSLTP